MRLRAAVALAVSASVLVGADGGAARAEVPPALGLSASSADPGQTVLATGRGWAAGAVVDLAVCGGGGLGTSTDCAVESARQAVADATGAFTVALPVAIPPAPCPCVVRGSSGGVTAQLPIAVAGAPVGLPRASLDRPEARLEVETAVEGSGPWTAWFGASPQRTLVVTVRNVGDAAVRHPDLAITVADGGGAPRSVATLVLDALAPGDEVTERIGVGLGGLAWGRSTLRAEVAGAGSPVAAESQTSSYPWALLAAAVVALQAVLLGVRNRIRRRLAVAAAPTGGATSADAADEAGVIDVTDVTEAPLLLALPAAAPAPVEVVDLTEPEPVVVPAGLPEDLLGELARYRDLTTSASGAIAQARRTVEEAATTADRALGRALASFEVQVATATAALEAALAGWRTEVASLCDQLHAEASAVRAREAETVAAADAVTASLLEAVRVATDRVAERAPAAPPMTIAVVPPTTAPFYVDLGTRTTNGH